MELLRKRLFKNIFGVILFSVMFLKICDFSIAHFYSSIDPVAVEKNSEAEKDIKEDAVDKKEKKLYTHVFTCINHGHLLDSDHLPPSIYLYILRTGSQPLKTVPTPPPNYLV